MIVWSVINLRFTLALLQLDKSVDSRIQHLNLIENENSIICFDLCKWSNEIVQAARILIISMRNNSNLNALSVTEKKYMLQQKLLAAKHLKIIHCFIYVEVDTNISNEWIDKCVLLYLDLFGIPCCCAASNFFFCFSYLKYVINMNCV